jgi:hypothetical protein
MPQLIETFRANVAKPKCSVFNALISKIPPGCRGYSPLVTGSGLSESTLSQNLEMGQKECADRFVTVGVKKSVSMKSNRRA